MPETFLAPHWLWLLLGVAALAVLYAVAQFRSRSYAVKFTNLELLESVAPKRPGWRRHIPAAAFLLSLVALVLAIAKPATTTQVPRERATIIMAIDTSLSMMADDVDPTRIDAAKLAAANFLDQLPEKINVGLVTFNGVASVRVTPTTDRQAVRAAIVAVELGEATAIGEAIFAGLDAIETVPADDEGTPPPARIILMSDGETTVGRPDAVATAAANEVDVPVSTIAFGTDAGIITIPQEPVPIPVPVNEGALRNIAEDTNGTFFEALTASELEAVYADIGSSVGFVEEQQEITQWFIAAGLGFLFITAAFSLLWFSRLP